MQSKNKKRSHHHQIETSSMHTPATVTGESSSLDLTWPSSLEETNFCCTLWHNEHAMCTTLTATSNSLAYLPSSINKTKQAQMQKPPFLQCPNGRDLSKENNKTDSYIVGIKRSFWRFCFSTVLAISGLYSNLQALK